MAREMRLKVVGRRLPRKKINRLLRQGWSLRMEKKEEASRFDRRG